LLTNHLVIPEGQIATQPGVQAHDLLSFFSQLEAWSDRHHVPLYTLQHDQMKGFDCLEPEGFYDAVQAYGLPDTIINFDQSVQTDVPYQVKTAFGLTDMFSISGVTKQGGPLSPLKSTLTTSLGNRWAYDCAQDDPGTLWIRSCHSRDPHLPGDSESLLITMVKAMDDSEVLSTNLPALQQTCLLLECFQGAYGWITSWAKSEAYAHQVHDPPTSFQMPSINPSDLSSSATTWQSVRVVTDHVKFLCTKVNAPHHQFLILDNLTTDFWLPDFHTHLPIPMLCKLFSQLLVSRVQPQLAYQPLTPADALLLDFRIAHCMHEYLGFPFHFNTHLFTLPLTFGGFDFPSISRLNAAAAVSGLTHDLNHFLLAFHTMACIIYHDWMCQLNHCISLLSPTGLRRHFATCHASLPSSWVIAHQVLRSLSLSLVDTDQSYISSSKVSLRHIANLLPHSPSAHTLLNLASTGYHNLSDVGAWITSSVHHFFQISSELPAYLRFTAAYKDWPSVHQWLQSLPWGKLVQGPSPELLLSPSAWHATAEAYLTTLSSLSTYPSHHQQTNLFWV